MKVNTNKSLTLVYTVPPNEVPGPGLMLLGVGVDNAENMKLLWSDDAYTEFDDSGDDVSATFNNELLEEYGIKVTSPWRFEIEYFEADCQIVIPLEVNNLTLP